MTLPLTPGAYFKRRREEAGLSRVDVAARLVTEPHNTPEHIRVEWLGHIEADYCVITLPTIVDLRRIFPFDLDILFALEAIRQGAPTPTLPPLCRICACSKRDRCAGMLFDACVWVEHDLCSACADRVDAA